MELDFEVYDAGNGDLKDIFSIIVNYDELSDSYVPDPQDWAVAMLEWGDQNVVLQVQDRTKQVKGFSDSGTLKLPLSEEK